MQRACGLVQTVLKNTSLRQLAVLSQWRPVAYTGGARRTMRAAYTSTARKNNNSSEKPKIDDAMAKEIARRVRLLQNSVNEVMRLEKAEDDKKESQFYYLISIIVIAFGLTYAAVPMYRVFCQATGMGGTPRRLDLEAPNMQFDRSRMVAVPMYGTGDGESDKRIKVTFSAQHSTQLKWSFKPSQSSVRVLPGETALAFFKAKNLSDQPLTGRSHVQCHTRPARSVL